MMLPEFRDAKAHGKQHYKRSDWEKDAKDLGLPKGTRAVPFWILVLKAELQGRNQTGLDAPYSDFGPSRILSVR
jgi:hypothetical protein